MAKSDTAAKPDTNQSSYPTEFIVEFGDDWNRNPRIQTLTTPVRGQWSLTSLFQRDGVNGGPDVGQNMTSMPDVPGQCLKVSPRQGKVVLFDPLEQQPELLEKISTVLNKRRGTSAMNTKRTFVKNLERTLNPDQMKTLLIELIRKEDEGTIHRVIKGNLPTMNEVDAMDGYQLHDVGSGNAYKPKYAKDADGWAREINARR